VPSQPAPCERDRLHQEAIANQSRWGQFCAGHETTKRPYELPLLRSRRALAELTVTSRAGVRYVCAARERVPPSYEKPRSSCLFAHSSGRPGSFRRCDLAFGYRIDNDNTIVSLTSLKVVEANSPSLDSYSCPFPIRLIQRRRMAWVRTERLTPW